MIRIRICEKETEKHEYFSLPNNKYSVIDELDRLAIFGETEIEIAECNRFPELAYTNFSDTPTLDELNFLAQRLDEISNERTHIVAYRSLLKNFNSVSIGEAINYTYGLETVPVYPCEDAEEYGGIVIDNELLEELNEIPNEYYDLLDCEKVGRLMQEHDGGFFINGYYAIPSSYEPQLVYDDVLPAGTEDWVFKLKLADPENEDTIDIIFPLSNDMFPKIPEIEDQIVEHNIIKFESFIPKITGNVVGFKADVCLLNNIARQFSGMSREEAVKFKAIMERERPENLSEVSDLLLKKDCFEFDITVRDLNDYGRNYLSEMLPPDFDRSVLCDSSLGYLGRNIAEKNNAESTEYGMVSSMDGQLYSMIEAEQQNIQSQDQGQEMSL